MAFGFLYVCFTTKATLAFWLNYKAQEAMESFAFPDKIKMTKYLIPFIFMTSSFYGKLHIVQLCIC